MSFQQFTCKIQGVVPLLLHNGQLANPLSEGAKALKSVTSKRKKTDKDYEEMSRIEWFYGLHVKDGKPIVTAEMIEATFLGAAKLQKLGKQASRGMTCPESCLIRYPEEKLSLEELYKNPDYVFVSIVRVGQSKVNRTRPRFNEWSMDLQFLYDDGVFNKAGISEIVEQMGSSIGFGDWRPKFGRFEVVSKK